MKRIFAIWPAALLLLCMAGCGGGGETPATEDGPGSKYVFDYNGAEVAVNAEMAPLAAALGQPTDYFESESCAFQGLDKVYTYGSVIIRTYPEDGKDYVLSVQLRDDAVSTREGVRIGASRADVTAVYGEPAEQSDGALRYTDGGCTLTFILSDGRVTDITYTARTP